jgi:hypothetical protein
VSEAISFSFAAKSSFYAAKGRLHRRDDLGQVIHHLIVQLLQDA